MAHYTVRVTELLLESYQNAAARLVGPAQVLPRPGQYLHTHDPADPLAVLATPLFAAGAAEPRRLGDEVEFSVAGPLPASWQPGARLLSRGPLGPGFTLPKSLRRLALAASGSPARLLPLLALAPQAEAALFCDAPVAELPTALEVQPLAALPSALGWADFLALDVGPEKLDELPSLLGVKERMPKTLHAQALVTPPMPCGGLAQCGVCTIETRRGPRLACEHGPVFNIEELVLRV